MTVGSAAAADAAAVIFVVELLLTIEDVTDDETEVTGAAILAPASFASPANAGESSVDTVLMLAMSMLEDDDDDEEEDVEVGIGPSSWLKRSVTDFEGWPAALIP
jgi:hypothetical protein